MQRGGVDIKRDQHNHHRHRAGEHRYRTEHPHQQIDGEVDRPETHEPEVAPHDHLLLNAAHRNVVVRHADEEVCVDQVPRRLHKAAERHQEAEKQRQVLDVDQPRTPAAVDIPTGEEIHRRAPNPRPDQGGQDQGNRGQGCRCARVAAQHRYCSPPVLDFDLRKVEEDQIRIRFGTQQGRKVWRIT